MYVCQKDKASQFDGKNSILPETEIIFDIIIVRIKIFSDEAGGKEALKIL